MQSIERQQFISCCMWLCHFLHMVVEAASSVKLAQTFVKTFEVFISPGELM